LKLLTDKNSFLRRRIINQTIPFLNGRLNHYTQTLGLPHVVKFDADMSCTVAEFGRELDFGNLSAGERKRVNTSMALAFRDVLHHMHAKTNLLLIDELDGALDQNGIDSIVRVLKEKSRDEGMSIFVISHHPSIAGRLDRDLRIIKENGFSRVEQT
jgi:DNA repair exonuclease SbcCD ATPase subunit